MSEGLPGWVRHDEDGLISYAVPDCERFLEWMAHRDFLFHGSPFAIKDALEPRRAMARGVSDEFMAIYFTDIPPQAIFCALVERQTQTVRSADIVRELNNGVNRYDRVRLLVNSEGQIRSHGYIYLVPKEEAEGRNGGDYVCFHDVRPSLVLRVTRSDLRHDIRIAGPARRSTVSP